MFWEKKEERKGLPELPPLKPSLRFDNIEDEESSEEDAFASYSEKSSSEELPELPAKFRTPKTKEIEDIPMKRIMPDSSHAKTEDVYVKIDKFHSARKALNGAREKLKEVDELMRKIRETKMREEQELSSWESEIEAIKSKVEDVTKNIFEKVE